MRRFTRYVLFFLGLLVLAALLNSFAHTVSGLGGVGVAATMWACFGVVYALLLLEPMVRAALLMRRDAAPDSAQHMHRLGSSVAHDSGITTPAFYIYGSDKLEILVAGIGRSSTVILSTVAARLDDGLLRAILAHEFAHVRLSHAVIRLAIYGALLTLAILANSTPFVVLLANFFALWMMRRMEFAADRAAAKVAGAEGVRAALAYVASVTGDSPRWLSYFAAHPTFRDRIARLS